MSARRSLPDAALRRSFPPRGAALPLASLALALAASIGLGCRARPIELPAPQSWRAYQHPTLGVALELPDFLTVREDEGGALFRIHGANAVLLRFVDDAEAKRRGLWIGTPPAGPITLGGRAGLRYVYNHDDGPIWDPTEAYVVPYRGKSLALEFRTHDDDAVRQRMLASFRFLAEAAPSPAS